MRTETIKDIIDLFDNADIMMAYHDLLCGDLIDEGNSRIVYECDYDKSCVIKIHKDTEFLPSDIKRSNFGMYKGHICMHDYAFTLYRLGISNKMRKISKENRNRL